MPRPRKRKNEKLPNGVYCDKGRYYLKPYLGLRNGKRVFGKQTWLAPADAAIEEVWAAYSAAKAHAPPATLAWLSEQYLASPSFDRLAPKTKELYRDYWKRISQTKTSRGVFGVTPLADITPGVIRKYLDKRIRDGAAVASNKERGFLSVVFAFGVERDLLDRNPVEGTRTQPYVPRDRYVTDEEYKAIYALAPAYVQDAMEIAYLCRARLSEVLSLRVDDLKDEGLFLKRTKGSKTQVIRWSPRLRAAVGRTRPSKISSFWVIHNARGQRIPKHTLQTAWQRTMRKALASHALATRFTFHDLKAKGVSDFDGDKFKASGHKSPRMTAVYDRKVEEVDSTK